MDKEQAIKELAEELLKWDSLDKSGMYPCRGEIKCTRPHSDCASCDKELEAQHLLSSGYRNIKNIKLTAISDEMMINAVWEAGNKWEAEGNDLRKLDQKTRFRWIAQAQLAHNLKEIEK